MHKFFAVVVIVFLISCSGVRQSGPPQPGPVTMKKLLRSEEAGWIEPGLKGYRPDTALMDTLGSLITKDTRFLFFGGTWCSDTHILLPFYARVMKDLDLSKKQTKYYLLDENKQSPKKKEEKHAVSYIPTIIVFRDGVEIGRITESVKISVEKDLVDILRK